MLPLAARLKSKPFMLEGLLDLGLGSGCVAGRRFGLVWILKEQSTM